MKTIKERKNKLIVILDDDDELKIECWKNNYKLNIKCIDSVLHIDDDNDSEQMDFRLEEEKAIAAMKRYLEKNPDGDEEKK